MDSSTMKLTPMPLQPVAVSPAPNSIVHGDCLDVMGRLSSRNVPLAFADPPFDVDYVYGQHRDHLPQEDYLRFSRAWRSAGRRVLTPAGLFYLGIEISQNYVAQSRQHVAEELATTTNQI